MRFEQSGTSMGTYRQQQDVDLTVFVVNSRRVVCRVLMRTWRTAVRSQLVRQVTILLSIVFLEIRLAVVLETVTSNDGVPVAIGTVCNAKNNTLLLYRVHTRNETCRGLRGKTPGGGWLVTCRYMKRWRHNLAPLLTADKQIDRKKRRLNTDTST